MIRLKPKSRSASDAHFIILTCTIKASALAHLRSCPQGNDPLVFNFGDFLSFPLHVTHLETIATRALGYGWL